MTLEELNAEAKLCARCRLREGATQVVPGEGSAHAEIMFIGEGPGAVEDKTGRPFVGPAGKFLDELLKSIGLVRGDIFITNMVKCRPPENRDPRDDEMEICTSSWLEPQIKLINPKVFVPLGRHALHKFLPGAVISKEHGELYERGGLVYFVMYHPAVALYNGSYRKVLLDDFKTLREFLDGAVEPETLNDAVSDIIAEKRKPGGKGPDEPKRDGPSGGDSGQVGMSF
ncbi:MAG: uracil-DNA glycosylase [Candidatus Dojkabacteria bacterium]|nr:uracil-DNA glycosylase [Candidatus Dojkabacteria bacterium]